MSKPLMPKATAVWLIDHTSLTFEQIADFVGLHELEVQAIADEEVAGGIIGLDPVTNGQLSRAEIERCEKDETASLKILETGLPAPSIKSKGARYTPIAKRADKPDAIAWLVKNQPDMNDAQISALIGTTKPTINAVRDRTHWNAPNIHPRHPVELGMCTRDELDQAIKKARERAERQSKREAKKTQHAQLDEKIVADTPDAETPDSHSSDTTLADIGAIETDTGTAETKIVID